MDVIIHGSTGRMGRAVRALAESGYAGARVAALVGPDSPEGAEENCYTALERYTGAAHCVVDFSHHTAAGPLLAYCREQGKRGKREIGIHSLRLGGEVGTHEILIATGSETITLKHRAEDRSLFAEGALTAAAFLRDKPAGLYTMEDIIKKEK